MRLTQGSSSAVPTIPPDAANRPVRRFLGLGRAESTPRSTPSFSALSNQREGYPVAPPPPPPPPAAEKIKATPPWARGISSPTGKPNAAAMPPPHSSATPPPTVNTATAQILSLSEPKSASLFISGVLAVIILVLPIGIVLWGSYQGWPKYLTVPTSWQIWVDRIIARSPLPKTPRLVLNPMVAQINSWTTFKPQLSITATHDSATTKFTLIATGEVERSPFTQLHFTTTTTWIPTPEVKLSTASQTIYRQGILSLLIEQADPFSTFNLQGITGTPILFTLNPVPMNQNDSGFNNSQSYTPGEFALTKIRNQKLAQLLQDYYQILMEKATLPETDTDVFAATYQVHTQLTNQELLNFFKEFIAVYQESLPQPAISQPTLQTLYRQLEAILNDVDIVVQIDRNTLQLTSVQITSQLTASQLSVANTVETDNFTQPPGGYKLQMKLIISDINQPLSIPPTPAGLSASSLPWPTIITYPLIQPLLGTGASL